MNISFTQFFLAASPIVAVLVLMIGFRWGGARAGAAGWLVALLVAIMFFGANPSLLATSQMRALLLTLYVLYIIWMSLILYNVVKEAGAIEAMGQGIVHIAGDKVLQLLVLSWVFSSFLQGVSGFGVPIAIVAPLLIGLGFSPVTSVAAVAIGHAWSVTFGSIAAAFNAMVATSSLPAELLAPSSALFLGIVCFLCGIAAVFCYQGIKSVIRGLPAILIIGTVMSLTQYFLATTGMWNISAFVAGMTGLLASVLVGRLPFYRRSDPIDLDAGAAPDGRLSEKRIPFSLALAPYLVLIVIVGVAELYAPVKGFLNIIKIEVAFPQTQTTLGWVMQAGKGQAISLFGHPGALLLYTALITYLLYAFTGHLKTGALNRVLQDTLKNGLTSSIGIAAMVGFAIIMEQSGMTTTIAVGLSQNIKGAFPFLSPFIGVLGAFMTGSNTNSNVVFALLQKQTAELLGLSVPLILAAQTTGGAIGGMLAPARIIVGCSTAGLVGREGEVLKPTIITGLVITVIVGVITLLAV